MVLPPVQFSAPGGFLHFRCPAFPPGAVLPPFHDFISVRHEECQLVLVFRSDSRYFTGKRIESVRLQNLCSKPVQSIFRNLLGWTGIFPKSIEGGADPNRSCLGDFSAVMLAAASAFNQPGKWIGLFSYPWVGMFLCSAVVNKNWTRNLRICT